MSLLERGPQLIALTEYAADARRGDGRLVLAARRLGLVGAAAQTGEPVATT